MRSLVSRDFRVVLHWHSVCEKDDPRWKHNLALYAYLAPFKGTRSRLLQREIGRLGLH